MGELDPTRPIETTPDGHLIYHLYAQDGSLVRMTCADTPHNRHFIVWVRQHDRYGGSPDEATQPTGASPNA